MGRKVWIRQGPFGRSLGWASNIWSKDCPPRHFLGRCCRYWMVGNYYKSHEGQRPLKRGKMECNPPHNYGKRRTNWKWMSGPMKISCCCKILHKNCLNTQQSRCRKSRRNPCCFSSLFQSSPSYMKYNSSFYSEGLPLTCSVDSDGQCLRRMGNYLLLWCPNKKHRLGRRIHW